MEDQTSCMSRPGLNNEMLTPRVRFWEIAIPMVTIIIFLFFWTNFLRTAERVKKMIRDRRIDKMTI